MNTTRTIHMEETRNGVKTTTTTTIRYFKGCKDPAQDKRPSPKVARIISQDYAVIKRECLAQGALWEDPNFPVTDESVYPSGLEWKPVQWRRPGDICKDPKMFVDGFSRFDVQQGTLNNCWLLAAIASLCSTENKELFHQVVPEDNLFSKDYAGVFHFRLWQYGTWVDVVVDDRLPTNEKGQQLIYARSTTNNEFWPALLEKAYAKLNGSYAALESGNTSEAMQDFTGGITENFDLQGDIPKDLFTITRKALERDSLLGCSVSSEHSKGDGEGKLPNGLIVDHAYSITSVKQITVRGRNVNLIRVRNPWANKDEWNGAWSDGSPEWEDLSVADKKSLGLTFEKDGEFWMSYDDFVKNFSRLQMCMAAPTSSEARISSGGSKIRWEMTEHEGSWKRNVNAGGCTDDLETFCTNTQYKVQVVTPDEDEQDNKGTLIVALMQKDRRKQEAELGRKMLQIGYIIYKIPDSHEGPQKIDFFRYTQPECVPAFIDARETVGRYKLPLGSYLIIPSTYDPHIEGDFLLRIFSEKPTSFEEIDVDTRFIDKSDVKAAATQDDRDEERDLKELFIKTAGSDLEIDAYELRSILDDKLKAEFNIEGVNLETARSMLAMMDSDHSGKLGYDEFKNLWTNLRRWKKVFLQYDFSKTNSLSARELRAALDSSGFRISSHTFNCLVMRYSDPKGFIQFDDFLLCAARLKTMFDIFQPSMVNEVATFNLDQIIQTTMYA